MREEILYKGKWYESKRELCVAYGMNIHTVSNRMKRWHCSFEIALETPLYGRVLVDHLGNRYDTMSNMAKAWHINLGTLCGRLISGWDIKSALTIPVTHRNHNVCKRAV